jgi:hypothetical protein
LGSRITPPAGGGAGRSRGGSRKFRCGAVAAQGEPIIDGRLTTVLVDAGDGTRVLSLIGDLVLATSPPVERQPCGPARDRSRTRGAA